MFWIVIKKNSNVFYLKWLEIFLCWFTTYVETLGKNFKNEFSFVSFEQSMRKKYMFKAWIYKTNFDEHGGIYNLWHVLLKFDVIVTLETKVESLLPTTIYK